MPLPGYLSVLSLPCIYRDLKSANVFLSETNCIKIGDLGVAKLLAATRAMAKTQIGTPYYVSPELWKNKPYNAKSDIWALGCLFYEMVVGKPPFDSNDMRGLARKVMRGVYSPISSKYSDDIREVIGQLLNVNPSARPSVSQILKMPQVAARMNLLPVHGEPTASNDAAADLVGTIHVPRKLRDLTKALPTPRYEDEVSPKPPKGGAERLPNLPSATPAPEAEAAAGAQQVHRSPPGDPSPENPVSDAAFKPHKPRPPQGGYQAKPPSRSGYGSEASSARSYQVPRSSRSRQGNYAHKYPGSSRTRSGVPSSRYSQQGRGQSGNYGPYHRRAPAGAPSRGGRATGSQANSGYYAGSQYARAGYAGHYDQRQPAGGQPGGNGEWERAIEARLARVRQYPPHSADRRVLCRRVLAVRSASARMHGSAWVGEETDLAGETGARPELQAPVLARSGAVFCPRGALVM